MLFFAFHTRFPHYAHTLIFPICHIPNHATCPTPIFSTCQPPIFAHSPAAIVSPLYLPGALSAEMLAGDAEGTGAMGADGASSTSVASAATNASVSPAATPPATPPADAAHTATALQALVRLALVRGELSEWLLALRALMHAAGWGGVTAHPETRPPPAPPPPRTPRTVCAAAELRALAVACESSLTQRGLRMSPSVSLGSVRAHPTVGVLPNAEFSSRGALLASGHLEVSAAAAVLSATLAQAAVGAVWGVGPWEHTMESLHEGLCPSELASAVAAAAAPGGRGVPTDGGGDGGGSAGGGSYLESGTQLPLHLPSCVDVAPVALRRLMLACAEALEKLRALEEVQSTSELALVYTSLALLRLLKAHLHFISASNLSLSSFGLGEGGDGSEARDGDAHGADARARADARAAEAHDSCATDDEAADDGRVRSAAGAEAAASGLLSGSSSAADFKAAKAAAAQAGSAAAGCSWDHPQLGGPGDPPPGASSGEDYAETAARVVAAELESTLDASSSVAPPLPMRTPRRRAGGTLCPLVRRLRALLLRIAHDGLGWADPATGAAVGEWATAEAIAVLQVGAAVFFEAPGERRALLLQLLRGGALGGGGAVQKERLFSLGGSGGGSLGGGLLGSLMGSLLLGMLAAPMRRRLQRARPQRGTSGSARSAGSSSTGLRSRRTLPRSCVRSRAARFSSTASRG